MGDVIRIQLGHELPTVSQNRLRVRMHKALWKERWRKAKEEKDFEAMDRLDREYEYVGLP